MDTQRSENNEGVFPGSVNALEIIRLCLSKWYLFVISVVICLAAAMFLIKRTVPQYSRTMTILIKEQLSRRAAAPDIETMISSAGGGATTSRLVNEIIAFQSPELVSEVVSRLGLETEYAFQGRFRPSIIYGSKVPLNVVFTGDASNVTASFTLTPSGDGKVQLSKLRYLNPAVEKPVTLKQTFEYAVGDTVDIEVARFVIKENELFTGEWKDTPMSVTKRSNYSATRKFSSELDAIQTDTKNRSDVLDLRIVDANIQRAEDFLRMLLNVYNENWVDDKNKMAVSTSMFINDRLAVIEKELGNVDENIAKYKGDNLIPDVGAVSTMYMNRSTETARRMHELENDLYVTRFVRNYLSGSDAGLDQLIPMGSSISNSGISQQITEYNQTVLRRNDVVANSSELNPIAVTMAKSLAALRAAIVESVDNEEKTLEGKMQALRAEDEKTTKRIAASPNQAKYLLSVERQQKVKESLYLFLLQKREENELSQAFTAYNTRLITAPTGSFAPVSPKSRQMYLIAFLIGLFIPLALIYLSEVANTKVRGRKDLEAVTVPFLGEVPQYLSGADRRKMHSFLGRVFRYKAADRNIVVVREGKRDIINEAFRVLRTNLEFMARGSEGSNVMVVTSYNPGSGKSFLSINIGVALAIKGKKVLCIDGDLRHASLSKFVDSPKAGLSDYLAGKSAAVEPLIVRGTVHEGLDVLPVGTIPPNPSELIGDPRFKAVLETLKPAYDYVLIDCPPLDIVADTQIIQDYADRVIFVVRARLFDRTMLPALQSLYDNKRFSNMCYILNGTDASGSRLSSHYSYHNGKYYDYYHPAD